VIDSPSIEPRLLSGFSLVFAAPLTSVEDSTFVFFIPFILLEIGIVYTQGYLSSSAHWAFNVKLRASYLKFRVTEMPGP